MAKKRLYLVAVNNRYGDNVFLPYAAGLLWSYARQFRDITDAYELCDVLYVKEPIDQAMARLEAPDLVAFSSYIWNHEWNKQLCLAINKRWPECRTLVGGVQIEPHPDVTPFDFGIYGEGEGAFTSFLRAYNENNNYLFVKSLIWMQNIVNHRAGDVPLDTIPSPYLDGFFESLLPKEKNWTALQETNRGCPYQCTFCAWGEASLSKLRQFDTQRILAEYDWMARHKIELLYGCDANYGILPRDIALTEHLARTCKQHGYPKKFRVAFAKNSNETVFRISKTLSDAGMLKATTLALQSMKDDTLQIIKRKNIKYEKLTELSKQYEDAGISTYTELIVGLPGETLPSFLEGIEAILEAGQHTGMSIYLCMILPNTEMNQSEYRKEHGIETARMKALLYHGKPELSVIEEIQETVIGTKTMPKESLRRAVIHGWLIQALHGFGLTQWLARQFYDASKIAYVSFYGRIIHEAKTGRLFTLAKVLMCMDSIWNTAVEGNTWPTVDPRFGDIMWPPEELLFLMLACESERFYDELTTIYPEDLVREQQRRFIPPVPGHEEEYAREAVWFGRKGKGEALRIRGDLP